MDFEKFKPLIPRMVAGWRNILVGNPLIAEQLYAMHARLPRAEFERQVTAMLLARRLPFPVSGLGVAELSQVPEMFTAFQEGAAAPAAPTTNWGAIATGAATVLSSVLSFVTPRPSAAPAPTPLAVTTIAPPAAPPSEGIPTWALVTGGAVILGAIALYATS